MWKCLYEAWKRLAHRIGNFQARILLTLIYAVLVLPFGLAVRWLGDTLRTKRRPTQWLDASHETPNANWAHRQW